MVKFCFCTKKLCNTYGLFIVIILVGIWFPHKKLNQKFIDPSYVWYATFIARMYTKLFMHAF